MGFEELGTAVAMIILGLAFPPLGWMSALGAVILLIAMLNLLQSIWPVLVLLLVLPLVGFLLILLIDKLRSSKSKPEEHHDEFLSWEENRVGEPVSGVPYDEKD